jgi:hypothetical protein
MSYSDIIVAITALIILWYTIETYRIRKANIIIANANSEALFRMRRPTVSYNLFSKKKIPSYTFFKLINQSNYPVSVLVKCNFRINGNILGDIWPSYDGKEYWNLQYSQNITDNFCWLELYSRALSYKNDKD